MAQLSKGIVGGDMAWGLLAIGAGTLWTAQTRGWTWLFWPPALALNVLGEPQTNLSIQGPVSQTNGTSVPIYDPAITAQLNQWRELA